MDMVCEKASDCDHDFEKDPIKLYLDDDILSSRGRTSIGADDGIGVSLALAVLEDKMLKHPKLEVLFTVQQMFAYAIMIIKAGLSSPAYEHITVHMLSLIHI